MKITYTFNGKEITVGQVAASSWPKFVIELINGYKIYVNVNSSTFDIKEKDFGVIGNVYNINDTIEVLREVSGLRETALTAVREAIQKEYDYLTNGAGRRIMIF